MEEGDKAVYSLRVCLFICHCALSGLSPAFLSHYPTLSFFSSMAAWDLSVTVEDLGLDAPPVTISVASDLHIGGVILKLVEKTRG